jgi:mannosyl-oligosaccharide alpha-1,2-mannosidase
VPGLFPDVVNARDCWFGDVVTFSIGGSADSVYEYFVKEHQLLHGASEQYKNMYVAAAGAIKEHILFRPLTSGGGEDILMAGTFKRFPNGRIEHIPEMQHLACFSGGMFALAAKVFDRQTDLETARQLVEGCIWAYNQTHTGIMPELFALVPCPEGDRICEWKDESADNIHHQHETEHPRRLPKGISAIERSGYELRPEAIESIFVLYRITGDETLREKAWVMFENIVKHTRTEYGFSSIEDVTQTDTIKVDRMESYWIAETLKYFYLLFEDPKVLSLDEFVFNTEAHPFRLNR